MPLDQETVISIGLVVALRKKKKICKWTIDWLLKRDQTSQANLPHASLFHFPQYSHLRQEIWMKFLRQDLSNYCGLMFDDCSHEQSVCG